MIDPAHAGSAWRLSRRPTAWLGHALAAGAGALMSAGVLILAGQLMPERGTALVPAAIAGALVFAGYALVSHLPAPARPVSTAAAVIGIAGAAGFLFLPHLNRLDELRPFWAFLVGGFTLCFFVGRLRSRSLFLGLALIVAWTWVVVEVASVETVSFVTSEIPGSPQLEAARPARPNAPAERDPNWGDVGLASALFGLTCLGAVILLDRRAQYGVPPALTPIGVVAVAGGVALLGVGAGSPIVGGALAALAGAFVGTAGAWAHRRFTVWSGAVLVTVGAAVIAGDLSDGGGSAVDSNAVTFGVVMIACGFVLTVLAIVLARMLGEPAEELPAPSIVAAMAAPAAVDPMFEPLAGPDGAPDDTVWAPSEPPDPYWPTT